MTRPIIFLDANTVWHRRLAEALAETGPVLAINPKSGLWPRSRRSNERGLEQVTVDLPRGWASASAFIGQRILLRHVREEARSLGGDPIVMLTSPAYAPLAEWLSGAVPVVSYTADDYRGYAGWGGPKVALKERRVHRAAALSVFVSESLRERAVREFGLDYSRTFVSPNATERRFADLAEAVPLPEPERRRKPVVGLLGALTDRLDLELLAQAAASERVGTFLVAGPASKDIVERYPVFGSEKCIVTGFLDHAIMHRYALALDLALIAYTRTELNHHCSPMRLYDHLATRVPILALEGCDQIDRAATSGLQVVGRGDFIERLEKLIAAGLGHGTETQPEIFWDFRSKALRNMLETLDIQPSPVRQS